MCRGTKREGDGYREGGVGTEREGVGTKREGYREGVGEGGGWEQSTYCSCRSISSVRVLVFGSLRVWWFYSCLGIH